METIGLFLMGVGIGYILVYWIFKPITGTEDLKHRDAIKLIESIKMDFALNDLYPEQYLKEFKKNRK
jgi:hypothetical protein